MASDLLSLELLLEDYLERVSQLRVNVEPPDLTDIVNAVQGLRSPATPEEIAQAIAKVMRFPESPDLSGALGEITEALKKLDFRLQGQGAAYGPSGPSNLVDSPDRKLGRVWADDGTSVAKDSTLNRVIAATNYLKTEGFYEVEALEGRMFGVGAELQTSVATPNASLTITNPAGSRKRIILLSWSCYADANATILYYFGGTQTGTLRTSFSMAQHMEPVPTSLAETRAGTGTYTPGNALPMNSRVGPNAPLRASDMYISLGPGDSFTQRFLGPGATNTVWMNFEYAEKAA